LTLNLKDMLMGDDFKKDTNARGVVAILIKSARDFKEGDVGLGPLKPGSSDGYVTVSWAKFAKIQATTRIILANMHPVWNEWCHLLVGHEELNAQEALRIQLWDSDRIDADDDLGHIEVPLHDLMKDSKTNGRMHDRDDGLHGEDGDEKMPGTLQWSVGYFAKTQITEEQLARQTAEPDIKTVEDLHKKVSETAERKLREATKHDESRELEQQKAHDYKERENALINSSPPPGEYPSGILSIEIHSITGLELQRLRKPRDDEEAAAAEDEAEVADDLPSSYCTIILNHQKIFKTRTKPKNSKPFFNAGTEKFLRDWRTAEVMVSVRDARVHENDALLGVVYFPLAKLLEKRSQVVDTWPLAGGVGVGRARISLVFRSVRLQMPTELRGWGYGTLEVKAPITVKGQLPGDIAQLRIRLRTSLGRAKMYAAEGGEWRPKRDAQSVCLAVHKRYASALVLEFRKSMLGPDRTQAFAVFWLSQIPDDEDKTMTLEVWRGGEEELKHASASCNYRGTKQGESPIGQVDVRVKFWHGLSGYHRALSKSSPRPDLGDVMEVLDAVSERAGDSGDSCHGDTDADDSGTDAEAGPGARKNPPPGGSRDAAAADAADDASSRSDGDDGAGGGGGGLLHEFRDGRKRRHRGLLQFQAPRMLDWGATKVRHGEGRVLGAFGHHGRKPAVETEV